MPIYEYVCQKCKHEFEVIRRMAEADESIPCTACGGKQVKRKLSLFFAESGGKAVSGMSEPACGSCSSSNCSTCGH